MLDLSYFLFKLPVSLTAPCSSTPIPATRLRPRSARGAGRTGGAGERLSDGARPSGSASSPGPSRDRAGTGHVLEEYGRCSWRHKEQRHAWEAGAMPPLARADRPCGHAVNSATPGVRYR